MRVSPASLLSGSPSYNAGLTELYRRIFIYLVVHSGMEGFEDRALEREIVAALESVFPRVGLRTFVTLVDEDKVTQVQELASIVFGIRLFNREIGKGGTGITDVPGSLRSALGSLGEDLQEQHDKISKACENYTLTINYMHRQKDSKGVPPRLRDELTNRRQYLACLHNLQEDCSTLRQRAEESVGAYNEVLEELQGIVGSRSSVPKEQVYPKFDRLAKVWKEMEEDLAQVEARLGVLATLLKFKQSFHTRLRNSIVELPISILARPTSIYSLPDSALSLPNSTQDLLKVTQGIPYFTQSLPNATWGLPKST